MNKFLTLALSYLPWIFLSLASGLTYLRLLAGPNPVPKKGLWYIMHMFIKISYLRLGVCMGGVIALIFIVTDIYFIKPKIGTSLNISTWQATALRILCLLAITIIVAVVHYVLEKVIDVI